MTDAGTSSVPTQIASAPSSDATSSTYPPCAQICLADATASLPCAETNSACLCLHASTVKDSVTSCLNRSNACSVSEATTAASYYDKICLALGYPTSEGQSDAGPIATASGVPTAVSTQLPSSTASHSSASHSHTSLSVPTIAGIAAGAVFLLVCIITTLTYLYIRRRSVKPSNPTVTIESPDPSNPKNRLRKTVSLRQSALYSPDDPEWNEKLSHIATLTDNEKHLEHDLSRKKSLPQTPISPADTLTNDSFTFNPYDKETYTPLPTLPPPTYTPTTRNPRSPKITTPTPHNKTRPPSIIYPSPFNPKTLFERSISNLSHPATNRPFTPILNSPTGTQFSDKASIYSATTNAETHTRTNSELSQRSEEGDVEAARANTLIMQRSRPTTLDFEALHSPSQHISLALPGGHNSTTSSYTAPASPLLITASDSLHLKPHRPPFFSRFSSDTTAPTASTPLTSSFSFIIPNPQLHPPSQRPPFLSQFSSDTTITSKATTRGSKPAPLTLQTTSSALGRPVRTTGSSAVPQSPVSPISPVSPTSPPRQSENDTLPRSNQTVSGASFGRFDFELSSPNNRNGARSSFMDFEFDKH